MQSDTITSTTNVVARDTWKRLYELASLVRKMEPWLWMEEDELFGVKDPATGNTAFVSVMGMMGEYFSIAVYPGAKALGQFWQMHDKPIGQDRADELMEVQHVQAVFGKKSDLDRVEKQRVAELGITCKGSNAWPRFLSFKPSWFSWPVDAQEARWLELALEQLLEVAPRVQADQHLLGGGGPEQRYLIRERTTDGHLSAWRDTHETCPPPKTTYRISIPMELIESVRILPQREMTIELGVFPSYTRVGKRGERPQAPYMLLAAESTSGFVLGVELLSTDDTIEDLWAQVPATFLKLLQRNQIRPAGLATDSCHVFMVMEAVCKELGIKITPDLKLKAVREARRSFEEFNRR
jgi:hypothetical protein